MKRLHRGLCLILCLSLVLLAGCGRDGFEMEERGEEKVYLRFAGYKVGENKVEEIERILNAYMETHKNTVIVYEGIEDNYVEVMTNRIENGPADDLFMISDQVLTTYGKKGWYGTKIEDLSGKEFLQRYSPMVRELFMVDGRVGAAPMCMSVTGMMANMEVLRACGIEDAPQTYSQWVEALRAVKAGGYTPMVNYMGNASSLGFLIGSRSMAPYVEQGVSFEGMTAAQVFGKGLRDIQALLAEGLIDPAQALAETEARSYRRVLGEQFAAGGVAFAVVPSWCITSFLEGEPDFEYRFTGLPVGDEGPLVNVRASLLVGINSEGENKAAAEEFLDYMMQPEHIEKYAAAQNGLSPLAGAKTDNVLYRDILSLIEGERFVSDMDPRIPFNLLRRLNYATEQILREEPIEQILADFDRGVAEE